MSEVSELEGVLWGPLMSHVSGMSARGLAIRSQDPSDLHLRSTGHRRGASKVLKIRKKT